MKFSPSLEKATLKKRYKRFLADVHNKEHGDFTAHCPNTGSMKNCWQEGDTVWLLDSENPKRKYRYTWVLDETPAGDFICINTHLANQIVMEAIADNKVQQLKGYDSVRQEVKYGDENSRIDLLLQADGKADCYVEIKTVTLLEHGEEFKAGAGFFPDAVSTRGQKHLRELMAMVGQGNRAVLFFLVQHTGIKTVSPAAHIDPQYAKLLDQAAKAGVEIIAYNTHISPAEIYLGKELPVIIP
ncbi:DNA/RNA nuclease SfsA [Kangiella koreensis]|uniref:Sugar fermentation stimulation protein homolog n=1 Tax=Kangiella koreensis (strain DSM 16069 / JCM 12317 / KCTC 12182 / SW-125) TaxID=523791 RepID=C7R7Z6_KANKD|nr:DNA/RNA nuclease SfsA [Kangiella koreensis]ACV25778.1 sugar fermentation stimulation protein [Kangiella koreensis DSM 16069]